jgi:hypothetical protein
MYMQYIGELCAYGALGNLFVYNSLQIMYACVHYIYIKEEYIYMPFVYYNAQLDLFHS